jgi:hypothetical protein
VALIKLCGIPVPTYQPGGPRGWRFGHNQGRLLATVWPHTPLADNAQAHAHPATPRRLFTCIYLARLAEEWKNNPAVDQPSWAAVAAARTPWLNFDGEVGTFTAFEAYMAQNRPYTWYPAGFPTFGLSIAPVWQVAPTPVPRETFTNFRKIVGGPFAHAWTWDAPVMTGQFDYIFESFFGYPQRRIARNNPAVVSLGIGESQGNWDNGEHPTVPFDGITTFLYGPAAPAGTYGLGLRIANGNTDELFTDQLLLANDVFP